MARKKKSSAIDAQDAAFADLQATVNAQLARVSPALREQMRVAQEQQAKYATDGKAFKEAFNRMMRHQMGLSPVPQKKKRTKKRARLGRPPEYDISAIQAAAGAVLVRGVDDFATRFYERLRDELTARHVKGPSETWLRKLAGPLYKSAHKKAHKSTK